MSVPDVVGRLPFLDRTPGQIGMLVEDLGNAMVTWSAVLGRDDWQAYTYDAHVLRDARYHGTPSNFGMHLALIGSSPQLKLIQPAAGPNVYADWIAAHGYGLHHVGFFVPSIAEAVSAASVAGYEPIQSARGYGVDGDGGFAYYDTTATLGLIAELIEVPTIRRPNEIRRWLPE